MKYIKTKKTNSSKSIVDIGLAEDRIFKYFISYALLIAYLLASISSTTDLMLLQSVDGMKLPFIDSRISIRGFYMAAPVIVAAASLYMAREFLILNIHKKKQPQNTEFIFSISRVTPGSKIFGVEGDFDKITLRIISYCVFFLLGPIVLLNITIRFSDYQDKLIFPFHLALFAVAAYLSWIFYQRVEKIFPQISVHYFAKLAGAIMAAAVAFKLIICIDVIFIPSKYSPTMYVKQHTKWLDNSDGGVSSIVPHLMIDRAIPISDLKTKDYSDISLFNDNKSAKDYFFSRAMGVDLRGRSLKYLDISFQIAPRIWAHDADLSGANLSFTKIPGSNFVNTNFYGANLSMSVMDGSRFLAAKMESVRIANAYFRGTVFDNTIFTHAFLKNVSFAGSSFFGVNIQDSILDGVNLSGTDYFETKIENNSMIIDDPNPIFPSLLSARNEFGEFSDAFYENEDAALSAIAMLFCEKSLSIADEIALKGITDVYVLMSRTNTDRLLKLRSKFEELSCEKAIEFLPNK